MSDALQEGPLKHFNGWTVLPPDIIEMPRTVVSNVDIDESVE
jgi:hypothetical protein